MAERTDDLDDIGDLTDTDDTPDEIIAALDAPVADSSGSVTRIFRL